MSYKTAIDLYQKLTNEWNSKPAKFDKCNEYLNQLKVSISENGFIPAEVANIDKKELHLTRDVLEIGAQVSIADGNIPAFERYIIQLKSFYFDFQNQLNDSPYKYLLLGLNLLCLLARNRLSDFHTELELLSPHEIQTNIYIKHPVSLEQYLMEGSYNKVFLSKGNVPSPSYNFFIDILLRTIRDEIASCMERAYKRISFNEAGQMLYFKQQEELLHFANERKWILADKFFLFKHETVIDQENQSIPSSDLVQQMLQYAKELEIIV